MVTASSATAVPDPGRPLELLAGLDVGTTSVKVLLMTPEGDEVAVGRAPTHWATTATGAETSADSLVDSALEALEHALRQRPDDRIVAIGVASMAESGVLVGGNDVPLAPVIAWHDHRDRADLDDLCREVGAEEFSRHTGLPTWTQWSLTKHRWLVDHLPEVGKAKRRYSVADWIVRSLGGHPAAELSLASRTGWLDLRSGQLWDQALDWSGADASLIPELVTAGTPSGRAKATSSLAAIDKAVLTAAGHDHQAAVVGVGLNRPGDEFDSCGTAEALVRTIAPGLTDETLLALTGAGVTVGQHVIRERWCLLGATQGGLILGRVMAALGAGRDDLAALDEAARNSADTDGVLSISTDSTVRITPGASPGAVWRAATAAVTAEAAGLSDRLSDAAGPRGRLVMAGGWTNSAALLDAKERALGTVELASTTEAGARGAALLGGLAAGIYRDYDDFPARAGRPA